MKDNYGQIGKTISQQVSLLNQDQNPLIANSGYITNPTTQITILPTQITTTFASPAFTSFPTTQLVSTSTTTPTPILVQTKSPGFEESF